MANPLRSGKDALPDHFTAAGDAVAAQLVIRLHASGQLTIEGPIADRQWCLDVLAAASDYIRNSATKQPQIVVPEKDVDLLLPGGGKIKL